MHFPLYEKLRDALKRDRRLQIGLAIAIAVAVVIFSVSFDFDHEALGAMQDSFTGIVRDAGTWGWLMVILLMILHSFIPFPLEFAAIAAGATYGLLLGTVLVWIGTVAGGALSFYISRVLGRPFVDRLLNQKQRDWLDRWNRRQGAATLLVSRLIPFISFTLVSYAAGLTPVGWWTFLWTSAVGMLPVIVISVAFGASLGHLPTIWLIAIPIVGVAIVVLAYRFAKRRGWIMIEEEAPRPYVAPREDDQPPSNPL